MSYCFQSTYPAASILGRYLSMSSLFRSRAARHPGGGRTCKDGLGIGLEFHAQFVQLIRHSHEVDRGGSHGFGACIQAFPCRRAELQDVTTSDGRSHPAPGPETGSWPSGYERDFPHIGRAAAHEGAIGIPK